MTGRTQLLGRNLALVLLGAGSLCAADTPPAADCPGRGYPTSARVEYVQDCMQKNGGEIANLYKCSCAIDWIAKQVSYDDFVEWATFAHNASMAGERGGVFRDTDAAREEAKHYRDLESEAFAGCGLKTPK
jgi:hypothetical protein